MSRILQGRPAQSVDTVAAIEIAVASVAIVSGVLGLALTDRVYADETAALRDAATAQDVATLLVGMGLIYVWTPQTSRSGPSSRLFTTGMMGFLAYNAAIYCFSVSFGPLFLLWTTTLGLATLALVVEVSSVPHLDDLPPRSRRLVGWVLITVSVAFALLWLREILGDLNAQRPSTSAAEWALPTNPVHVLDLAFLLPAAAASGIAALRGTRLGAVGGPVCLTVFALTTVPIVLTLVVADVRGHQTQWGVAIPLALVLVACCTALAASVMPRRSARGAVDVGAR